MIYTPIDWWIDYSVWLMLQYKFMLPAKLIEKGDEMSQFISHYSLNGIKPFTMCPN